MMVRRCPRLAPSVAFVAMLALALTLLPPPAPASAALRSAADSTVGVNGRVYTIVRAGNRVYIGGDFTSVRTRSGSVTRNHVAAIDATTGDLIGNWNPNANNEVRGIAVSPDGGTVYLGGFFTKVGGQSRSRLAAVSAGSGSAIGSWRADASSNVYAMAQHGNTLYVGGTFGRVGNSPRRRVAAIAANSGAVRDWRASVDGWVRSIAVAPNGSRVYFGGKFNSVNGQRRRHLAALTSGGALTSWSPDGEYLVFALETSGSQVFAGVGGPGGRVSAFDGTSGRRNWQTRGDGDVQALGVLDGRVYAGSHSKTIGGVRQANLAALRVDNGRVDTSFRPKVNSGPGVWAIDTASRRLYAGGDFTRINDRPQERFAQFSAP